MFLTVHRLLSNDAFICFFFFIFQIFLLLPKMPLLSGEGAGEQVRFVGNEKINGKVCRADVSAVNLRRVIMYVFNQ